MNFLAGCIHFILACILTVHGFDFDECPSKESSSLDVKYGSMSVVCDRNYPKDLVTSTPEIKFSFADVNKYYEVLMFDPDAPSAMNPKSQNIPKCQSWLHLYLSDVKGSELKKVFWQMMAHQIGMSLQITIHQHHPKVWVIIDTFSLSMVTQNLQGFMKRSRKDVVLILIYFLVPIN
ncbi:uncharacterized protein LOC124444097 [Xenia sp. Carnegie-2017]|uniref:uncharacterized protein LOC124444097 n=1 Tax=Xenia sp. Carnegie-2017 TaxID=2897299 RepID=UPI001F042003|nr:uncharacterized protein LOC124444097 [Xenia sp. Carnegie-2017]